MERHNPVNPKKLMNNRKEDANRLVGQGATPSMGLSEFRGGGTKKGQMRLTARKAYEPSEAHEMGRHLSAHIHKLHGAGFWSDFGDGFKQGFTGTLDALKPATAFIPGFNQVADTGRAMVGWGEAPMGKSRAKKMLGEMKPGRNRNNGPPLLSGNVNGVVSGGGLFDFASKNYKKKHGGRMCGSGTGAGMLEEPMPVSGTNLSLSGGANTGAYEGQGKGRSARAAIVKKVMAEKGLKMIEASKYVKEHKLY